MEKSVQPNWDEQTLAEAIAGVIIVRQHTHAVPYRLSTAKQQQRYAQAKEQGYVRCQATRPRPIDEPHPDAVFNAYERWCEIYHLPAVVITPGTRWASISFDLIYTKKKFPPDALEQAKQLLAGQTHPRAVIGSTLISVQHLNVQDAEQLAKALLALYHQSAVAPYE